MDRMSDDKKPRTVATTVSLTREEREKLEAIAADLDRSLSWTVGYLVSREGSTDRSRTFPTVLKHGS